MKSWIVLILLLILSVSTIQAKKIVKGYVINLSNDTIYLNYFIPVHATSDLPNIENLQGGITFIDSSKHKYGVYPSMVKEIGFTYNNITYRMYSKCLNCLCLACDDTLENNVFLERKIVGKLSLYTLLSTVSSGGTMSSFGGVGGAPMYFGGGSGTITDYLIQKNDEELLLIEKDKFIKDVAKYLKDCTELSKKIEEKKYTYKDIEKIVAEYNSNCK